VPTELGRSQVEVQRCQAEVVEEMLAEEEREEQEEDS